MIDAKKIAVIMPAFNEEMLIAKSINSVPEEVDLIFVINDCSKDATKSVVEKLAKSNENIILINNEKNFPNTFLNSMSFVCAKQNAKWSCF